MNIWLLKPTNFKLEQLFPLCFDIVHKNYLIFFSTWTCSQDLGHIRVTKWGKLNQRHVYSVNMILNLYSPFTIQVLHPAVRGFSQQWDHPQVAPFRPSCSHYRLTATDWTRFLNINNSTTKTHLMLPYSTERRQNHNLMYTVDHTFGYCSHNFIRTCVKSSAHAHSTKTKGKILNGLKLP